MKCKCPNGSPKLRERSFGQEAANIARAYGLAVPSFTVSAHRAPCDLPDECHMPIRQYIRERAGRRVRFA